jgi:hypothetical protein
MGEDPSTVLIGFQLTHLSGRTKEAASLSPEKED